MRRSIECHGYRDLTDLNFRDQSQDVVSRARRKRQPRRNRSQQRKRDAAPPDLEAVSTTVENVDHDQEPTGSQTSIGERESSDSDRRLSPPPIQSLVQPLEERAISYFMHNYTTYEKGSTDDSIYGSLDLSKDGLAANAFVPALTCVGMAGMARLSASPSLMYQSRRKQTEALRSLSKALGDPSTAKDDRTMQAVMLLTTYEVNEPSLVDSFHADSY